MVLPLPVLAAILAGASPASAAIEAPGPNAPLKGSFVAPADKGPVVLILPGSGPTDRDGNNPLGVRAATYRLLAEGLAARGIGSVRIDKRGMFESAAAIPDANAVTIDDYVADTHAWIRAIRARTGLPCIWLLGHSEGGLVALATGDGPDICGLILVSTAGRKLGSVLREQLHANPANAPILAQADAAIDALEKGRPVDPAGLDPALLPLFGPRVQKFVQSLFSYDPSALAAKLGKPLLIVQGDRDLQVSVTEDARRLKASDPRARLVVIPGADHVLKAVASDDRQANIAAYTDPNLPLAPGVVDAIADFVGHSGAGG